MTFLRSLLVVFLVFPLTACALSGEAIEGRVLEEGTDKPIAGAIVVVRWMGDTTSGSWFVESRTTCYHVETATTDGQGSYRTKPWRQPQHKDYTVKFDRIAINAYKPGYGPPSKLSRAQEIEYLAPFGGAREERLKFLGTFTGMQCGTAEDYAPTLIPLYKEIYREAKQLAVTNEEKKLAINRLRDLEEMEFGYDKSWENWRNRMRELQ